MGKLSVTNPWHQLRPSHLLSEPHVNLPFYPNKSNKTPISSWEPRDGVQAVG